MQPVFMGSAYHPAMPEMHQPIQCPDSSNLDSLNRSYAAGPPAQAPNFTHMTSNLEGRVSSLEPRAATAHLPPPYGEICATSVPAHQHPHPPQTLPWHAPSCMELPTFAPGNNSFGSEGGANGEIHTQRFLDSPSPIELRPDLSHIPGFFADYPKTFSRQPPLNIPDTIPEDSVHAYHASVPMMTTPTSSSQGTASTSILTPPSTIPRGNPRLCLPHPDPSRAEEHPGVSIASQLDNLPSAVRRHSEPSPRITTPPEIEGWKPVSERPIPPRIMTTPPPQPSFVSPATMMIPGTSSVPINGIVPITVAPSSVRPNFSSPFVRRDSYDSVTSPISSVASSTPSPWTSQVPDASEFELSDTPRTELVRELSRAGGRRRRRASASPYPCPVSVVRRSKIPR